MRFFNTKSNLIFSGSILGILSAGTCSLHAASGSSQSSSEQEAYDANLFNKDKSVFFVNAEFLYWLVNEGAVDYAVKMDKKPWSTTANTSAIGNYQNAHFDWTPGLRASFGYFRAPHYWDVFLQYTFVPATGTRTAHAPKESGEFLNGTFLQPELGIGGTSTASLHKARCHIALQYHVLDLLYTRRFQPNDHLRMGLFGGLTSAILFQKMKVFYEDTADNHSHINNRWRFEGIGFRIGLKLDWYLGYDLYLTGQASTAMVSGWYKNSSYQDTSFPVAGADNSRPIRDVELHDNRLAYTGQFLLGLAWEKRWNDIRTELFAGYELNDWWNLHQIYRTGFSAPTAAKETFITNSNLSLQGLTVRLNVDF